MNKTTYWFRWVAVFPGAIVASLLVTFPLHWLLYLAFAHEGTLLGFIELPPGANVSIEYILYPLIIAMTFIFAGYKIAPKYKFKTAIVLFGIYLVGWLVINFIYSSSGSIVDMKFSLRTMLSLVGAIIGLYSAKKDDREINNNIADDKIANDSRKDDQESDFSFSDDDFDFSITDDTVDDDSMYSFCTCGKKLVWKKNSSCPEFCKFCGAKLR